MIKKNKVWACVRPEMWLTKWCCGALLKPKIKDISSSSSKIKKKKKQWGAITIVILVSKKKKKLFHDQEAKESKLLSKQSLYIGQSLQTEG